MPHPPPSAAVAVLSRNPVHAYLHEVLAEIGLPTFLADPAEGPPGMRDHPVWIVLSHSRSGLDADWIQALRAHLDAGRAAVLLGAPVGFEDRLGVHPDGGYHTRRPEWLGIYHNLGEGWGEGCFDPISSGTPKPLHLFGGAAYQADQGTVVLARFRDRFHRPTDFVAGVARPRDHDSGPLVSWPADLIASVRHIRHGHPVDRDGVPAPDGTAPLDDDILKSEDGLVLDWTHDRTVDESAGFPYFNFPTADHLIRWLARSILWCADQINLPVQILRPAPKGVRRIAHISLDTDGNDPVLAREMIRRLGENNIPATWCHILPGYDPAEDLFRELRDRGHENAFHFDSGSIPGGPWAWSREDFLSQFERIQALVGPERIVSNKNHYTRWEGCFDCYQWCAESGIEIDGTRGPSKPGTIGFPFGSARPWRPLDRTGRLIDCLEFPFSTQDLVVTVPATVRTRILESAFAVDGHVHFLFHPQHITTPGVAQALAALVADAKALGAEWWTSREISAWERKRRSSLLDPSRGAPDLDWWTLAPRDQSDRDWMGFGWRKT